MRLNLKSIALTLCILVTSIGLLAGCMGSQAPSSSSRPIELTFWTLQLGTFAPYINGMISEYEKTHPDVHIIWVDVPASEAPKKSITSILAGTAPDVMNINPDMASILASRGTLLNMDQWLTADQKAAYLPVAMDACSLPDGPFGLPWYVTSSITIANAQVFENAGITQIPTTFSELAEVAQQIHDQGKGSAMMPILSTDGRFFRFLLQADIPLWNLNRSKLVFADHGAGKALAFWVRLYKNGLIPKESLTEGNQGAVDRYQSGALGLLMAGPSFLTTVQKNAPDIYEHSLLAPQFPGNSRYKDFAVMLLAIPKQTKHPKEAVEFARFVTNEVNANQLATLAPVLPPYASILESPEFQQPDSKDISIEARRISAQQLLTAETAFPVHPLQNRLNQLMDYYVQGAMRGSFSPYDAMRRAQTEMNQLLK